MIALFCGVVFAAEPQAEIEVVVHADPGPAQVRVDDVARPADGVEDVLVTVPGVRVRRLGGLGAFAGISLRGTGFRQTLVRLDGVPLNPDGVVAVDLSRFPLAGLETIQVTTGRPPATVGAAPIGGVVDLRTAPRPSFTQAELAVGSFRSVRGAAAVGRTSSRGVEGTLAIDGLATRGDFPYLDDGGTRFVEDDDRFVERANNDRRQLAGLGRLRVGDDGGRLTVLATGAVREEGLPGSIGIPLDQVRLATWRGLGAIQARQTRALSDRQLQLWSLVRHERLTDPAGATGRVDDDQRDRFGTVGLRGSGQRTLRNVLLRGSLAVRYEQFGRDVAGTTISRARRWGGAAAVDVPIAIGALTLTPGLDLRGLATTVPDRATVGAALPGVSAMLLPDGPVSAWVAATTGFRPPDLTELYGDRGTLVGNPDLLPERARKAELGMRASADGSVSVAIDAALSATWLRDAIGWLQNTQRTLFAVNFGRTRTLALEVGGRLAWRDRMGLDTSLTALSAVQTTADLTRSGRPVPFVAPVRSWSRAFVRPVRPITLSVDLDYTAAVPVDAQGVTRQPPRTLTSTMIAVTVARRLTLSGRVDNLFDVRTGLVARDPLSQDDTQTAAPVTDFVGYPLPGRTLWAAVRYAPGRNRP